MSEWYNVSLKLKESNTIIIPVTLYEFAHHSIPASRMKLHDVFQRRIVLNRTKNGLTVITPESIMGRISAVIT